MIKKFIITPLVILVVLVQIFQKGYAQTGEAISNIPSKEPAFCGFIDYEFKVEGEIAEDLAVLNDIRYMTLIIREGDFIVQLYGDNVGLEDHSNFFDPYNPIPPKIRQVFPTTRIFLSDSNHMYIVDAANKRVFRNESYKVDDDEIPTAVPLGDSIKILNVMCYGYKAKKRNGEEIIFYISPKYRVDLSFFPPHTTARAAFLTKGLNGCIPLKTIRKNSERKIEIVATRIQRKNFKKEEFTIPKSFKILGYDYRR
ncbi:MAG: hypothetical protein RML72_06285 [Bacteroidia bacterium]|nr:hypothetical protein [Bacteroidia bacterium]MDW8158466.1 hypothetical protein [Bacteroidia bacterium]